MSRVPVEFQQWPPDLAVEFGPYRGVVRHLVDGDTFDAFVSLGMHGYTYQVIRVLGLDTPEINRLATREAGRAALDYVHSIMPVGSRVVLHTEKDPDSFGRFLARVTLTDGSDLATAVIDAGYGVPYEKR